MPVPDVIPIAHDDHHTQTIGRYAQGQFLASLHGAVPGDHQTLPADVAGDVHWFAYIHLFDVDGRYRSSKYREIAVSPRLTPDQRDQGDRQLHDWLDELDGHRCGDIAIRPFRADHDGIVFGLIDESEQHGDSDWAELYPDRLGFYAPWDGAYDT